MPRLDPHAVAVWTLRLHLGFTVLWTVAIPVVLLTGLKSSLPFLVLISLWALIASHAAGAAAAMTGKRAEEP